MHSKQRHFIRLVDIVEQLASSNFSGDQEDVDRKEALDDILVALKEGTVRARGVRWEANETGYRSPINSEGNPEQITPSEWRDFEYWPDENELHDEDWNANGHVTWIEEIEVDCATAKKVWPGRICA